MNMFTRILSHFAAFAMVTLGLAGAFIGIVAMILLMAHFINWQFPTFSLEGLMFLLRFSLAVSAPMGLFFALSKEGRRWAETFRNTYFKTYRGE